jgi:hypothetical protein
MKEQGNFLTKTTEYFGKHPRQSLALAICLLLPAACGQVTTTEAPAPVSSTPPAPLSEVQYQHIDGKINNDGSGLGTRAVGLDWSKQPLPPSLQPKTNLTP